MTASDNQTTPDYRKPGDIVMLEGAAFKRMPNDIRYRYKVSKITCPLCTGVGCPWGGWFTCDSCGAVALVDTGETFIKKLANG